MRRTKHNRHGRSFWVRVECNGGVWSAWLEGLDGYLRDNDGVYPSGSYEIGGSEAEVVRLLLAGVDAEPAVLDLVEGE